MQAPPGRTLRVIFGGFSLPYASPRPATAAGSAPERRERASRARRDADPLRARLEAIECVTAAVCRSFPVLLRHMHDGVRAPARVAAARCHRFRQVYSIAHGLGLSQSVAEPGPGDVIKNADAILDPPLLLDPQIADTTVRIDVIKNADAILDPPLYWIRKLLTLPSESSDWAASKTKHGIAEHSRRARKGPLPLAASSP